MDFRTVMTVSALLLITADRKTAVSTTMKTPNLPQTTSNGTIRHHPTTPAATTAPTSKPSTSALVLSFLTVSWTHGCDGDVILYHPFNMTHPVCYSSNVRRLLTKVCQNRKGCKDDLLCIEGKNVQDGYHIFEDGATEQNRTCNTLRVHCPTKAKAIPDVNGQLQTYKVVAALLCCVLLILFLIRFTRPTVKALQKRLSDRRQNRWIGPTQSHSVSYHRGKTMVKDDDGEKRLSYPALERLTVSDSREPSSNRNSGYNF
ncbi:uncharacterized protein LOC130164909 [Seriola aureovittata]|uniref:uncharacterized protein LOC130164909 n=1 Tax=Seriola aureovittata TaxID=2871759 RepID=UPI0024BEA6EC|nr:uncharacterized protein LOC130164909 [Seriola aureovittata]